MIDKISGKIASAVMSFGGFLGIGEDYYPLPWPGLTYNPTLGGYEVEITDQQLKNAPKYSRHETWYWAYCQRTQKLTDYYGARGCEAAVEHAAPLSGSRSAIAASASSACCRRPQAWQYAGSTITSMAVSRPRTCSWGATLHHSSLAAGIKKPGGAGGGIGGVGSRKSIRLFPGLPRTILSRVGVGESR